MSDSDGEWALKALDALDLAIFVLTPDLECVHMRNALARKLFPGSLPNELLDGISGYLAARRSSRTLPPALRVSVDADAAVYIRVVAAGGIPKAEILLVRPEMVRDADGFRLLNARHGVTRREFQILSAVRLGLTNRQISQHLGLAEGTVNRHLHRLLERFDAQNRTRLVDLVEQILAGRQ